MLPSLLFVDAKDKPLFLDKFEICRSQPLTFKQGGQKGQGTDNSHLLQSFVGDFQFYGEKCVIASCRIATKTYPTDNLLLTTNPVQLCVRERRKFLPSLALEPAAVLSKIPEYLLPFEVFGF